VKQGKLTTNVFVLDKKKENRECEPGREPRRKDDNDNGKKNGKSHTVGALWVTIKGESRTDQNHQKKKPGGDGKRFEGKRHQVLSTKTAGKDGAVLYVSKR